MMPFCDLRPCLTNLFSPRATPNGILFSHSTSIPPQPRPEAPALHCNTFSPIDRLSTTRGIYSPYMPNTSNDRARNALRSTETEKFSRPQTLRPPHIGAQGRPYKMNTRKNRIHRRGGRRGIIGRRKWQQEIYYRGLSAGEGVVGVLYMDFRRVKGWRRYNNMELRKGWQGGY